MRIFARTLPLLAIRLYQRFISPYKGFRCAHAVYFGGDSCSSAVTKIIRRRGFFAGHNAIRAQFYRCRHAYQQIEKDKEKDKDKWWQYCDPSGGCTADCCPSGKNMDCSFPCDIGGCDIPLPCALTKLKK